MQVDVPNNLPREIIAKRKTVSEKKVTRVKLQRKCDPIEGYRLMDMVVLQNLIKSLFCPESYQVGSLYLSELDEKRKGLEDHRVNKACLSVSSSLLDTLFLITNFY